MVSPASNYGANTSQPYVSAGSELGAITGRGVTQQFNVPQGEAKFDGGRATWNFIQGGTTGFIGNTIGAIAANPLLAAGALALGVLVPPAGVAMAGAGLIGAGVGLFNNFNKSKQLANQADDLLKRDPYNQQQAAVLYRMAENQYTDMGSNTTGAVTSALSLGWMARGTAARAVSRGEMAADDLTALTEQKGFLGNNWRTLKENVASVTRKSEWVDSPGYKKATDVVNQWRDKTGKPITPTPDMPDPVVQPTAAASPAQPTTTTVNQYLGQNRHAQTMLQTMKQQSAKLENAMKTLESGKGNLTKANQQAIDAADELYRYSKAFKQAGAEGHFTEDLPPALTRAADDYLAQVSKLETRLAQFDDLNQLRQSSPQVDKLLGDIDLFVNGRGSKLQQLLGKEKQSLQKRGAWAEELQQSSETYRQQLEHILNTRQDLTPAARQLLTEKIDGLGSLSKANQTIEDVIWMQSAGERSKNPLNMSKTQKDTVDFTPLTEQQIQSSPWSALGFELERLTQLTQSVQKGRLNPAQLEQATQAIQASRQQALSIIDQGLLPAASGNNAKMQQLNSLRQNVAQQDGVGFLQQPLANQTTATTAETVGTTLTQAGQQIGQQAQQRWQQSQHQWQQFSGDKAAQVNALKNAVIGANIANANKGWLAPEQNTKDNAGQPGTQPANGSQSTTAANTSQNSNATSEPVGDYGRYVVINMGKSNFRLYKAERPNKVTQQVYDRLPLNERPYYAVDTSTVGSGSGSSSTTGSTNTSSQTGGTSSGAAWWQNNTRRM